MVHLIDKDALVAEIENWKQHTLKCGYAGQGEYEEGNKQGRLDTCEKILSFLDTLEVKEIDIEDSVKETLAQKYIDYTFRRHNIDANSKEGQLIYYAYMHGMNQCLTQLKARKGE